MSIINIKINAFIARTIGKKLKEFFVNEDIFKNANNRDSFLNFLNSVGGYWIPGPFEDEYVKTDDRMFGETGTYRVRLEANIDSNKILKREILQSSNQIFLNAEIVTSKRCLISFNSSSNTFIFPPQPDEEPADVSETQEEKYPMFKDICHTNIATDEIKGFLVRKHRESGYPFVEPISPNIDITCDLIVTKVGNRINFIVKGNHNKFPYYEILCNGKLVYSYYPTKYREYGPGIINLNSNFNFNCNWNFVLTPKISSI
ncbi:MAG: hypothetical protein FGM41_05620 [Bacteroidetes bacterium]|nr:hypothetical protein [Bacteroidota bacterium]